MTIVEFICTPWFRYGVFPGISAGSGVILKCVTRNDRYAFFKKEDMAVGPQIILTSVLTYVVVITDRAHQILNATTSLANSPSSEQRDILQKTLTDLSQQMLGSGWVLLGVFLMLWGITVVVKRWGWENETQLRPWRGIALPLTLGVFVLIIVMIEVQP